MLAREFYAPYSSDSSQWTTGCLPYRNGKFVFQQVRSYTGHSFLSIPKRVLSPSLAFPVRAINVRYGILDGTCTGAISRADGLDVTYIFNRRVSDSEHNDITAAINKVLDLNPI